MPSTHVWQTLAYLDTLDNKERDTLFDLWAERGSAMLTPVDYGQQTELVQHPAYQRYTAAVCGPSAWTYADPSYVRSIIEAQAQIPADWGPAEPPDLGLLSMEAVETAPSPQTARAPDVRREVKHQFHGPVRDSADQQGRRGVGVRRRLRRPCLYPHHRLRRFRQVPVWSCRKLFTTGRQRHTELPGRDCSVSVSVGGTSCARTI